MSNSVDQRIVDLKINYKDFAQGIKAAILSLDNLKKNMNMDKAANEFSKVEKASKKVNFNDMYTAVSNIESRFSTFGIVAMSALNNITNTAVNTGKRMLSALTAPLIEGGKRRALNIEQAKFQIEGLGYTWKQVEDDINYGVKDTAYGLDAAAKAASQLLASQVKVGEEMQHSLRGISGVAAMTSSQYEDIANIFTTVAGNGRLMGDQLMQLSSRGLNAAATLAQYLGVTEGEVRDMVSKGKIDFQTFADAMDSAFGEHAKKANETFTGSLSNMKAALSRIGANFATPAYQNLRDIFNSLTPVFDGVNKALEDIVKTSSEAMEIVKNFVQDVLPDTKEEVAAKLKPAMTEIHRIFTAFGKTIWNIATAIGKVLSPVLKTFGTYIGGAFLKVLGDAAEFLERFSQSLIISDEMSEKLYTTFESIFSVLGGLIRLLAKAIGIMSGAFVGVASRVFGFIADILLTITAGLGKIIVGVKNYISEIIQLESVQGILGLIRDAFNNITLVMDKVYNKVRELATGFLSGAFEVAFKVFKAIGNVLLNVANSIDKVLGYFKQLIDSFMELPVVKATIEKITSAFNTLKKAISGSSSELTKRFLSALRNVQLTIGTFINVLKLLISQYVQIPTFGEIVAKVQELISNAFEKSVEIFEAVRDVFGKILERLQDLNQFSFSGFIGTLVKVRDAVLGFVDLPGKIEALKNGFFALRDGSASALQSTGGVLDSFKSVFVKFIEWLRDKFGQLNMTDILAAGLGGTFIAFLVQLTKFTSKASELTEKLTGVVGFVEKFGKSIIGVFKGINEIAKAKAQAIKMEAITDIIKSVALLAGALVLLANVDQENLRSAAITLGALSAALIVLTTVMTSLMKTVDPVSIAKSATSVISIAASVLALVIALKILSEISLEGLVERLIALGVVMAEFAVLLVVLSKLQPEMVTGSMSIVSISISIMLLVNALKKIGSLGTDSIVSSIAVLTSLMLFLAMIGRVANEAKMSWQAALFIIAICVFLNVMMSSIKKLAKVDDKTMSAGLLRLIEMMALMTLFLKATKKAGKHAKKAAFYVLAISAAMILMSVALKKMADINPGMLSQATKSIVVMLGVFALLTASTKLAGPDAHKAGGAILMMSGAMLILAGAMLILGKMRPEEVSQATKSIAIIMGMFALIVLSTSVVRKAQDTIKYIAIAIAAIAGALAILALIEPKNLDHATQAISSIMVCFALLVASTSLAKKAYGAIAIITLVVGALAGMLIAVANLAPDNALESAEALSILLLSLSASLVVMQGFKEEMFRNVLSGLKAFIAVIAVLTVVIAAIGALNTYVDDLQTWLDNGVPALEAIGKALGSFVGGLVGGFVGSSSEGLVALGSNLSQFMENLKPFIEYSKTIDDSSVRGITTVVGMVGALTAASFIDSINIFGSVKDTITKVAEGLPELAEGFKGFADSLNGMNAESVISSSEAIKTIMETIAKIPPAGGLLSLLMGGQKMDEFAANLPLLGRGLYDYSYAIAGMDTGSVENTHKAVQMIIELANSLPNTFGGLLAVFTGGTFIDDFANQIPKLGKGLKEYSYAIAGMDTGSVENTKNACEIILDIANALPNTYGGLLSVFTGGNFIDDFANQIPKLGKGLKEYSTAIAGMDTGSVENTEKACKIILSLADALPNTYGGLASIFTGGTFIDDFADQVPKLARAFFLYAQNISGMDTGSIENASEACRSIIDLTKYIAESSGFFESITRDISMVDLASNLPTMAHAFFMYAQNIGGMDTGSVMNTVEPIKTIIDITRYISESAGLLEGLSRDISMVDLSYNLPMIAHAFFMYAQNVAGMDTGSVENTRESIFSIMEILKYLSDYMYTITAIFAETAMLGIIPQIGQTFFDYSTKVAGMDTGSVDNTSNSIRTIIDTLQYAASSSLADNKIVESIAKNLPSMGKAIESYYNSVSNIDPEVLANSIQYIQALSDAMASFPSDIDMSAINTFVENIKIAGTNAVQSFIDALNSGAETASAAAVNMVQTALNQAIAVIESFNPIFNASGIALVQNLIEGMQSKGSELPNALTNTLTQAVNKLKEFSKQFEEVGKLYTQGIVRGLQSGSGSVYAAVSSIGNRMATTLKNSLEVRSPSRVGMRIAEFFDKGIEVGVLKFAAGVLKAVAQTGGDMEDEMYSVFGKDYLTGMNINPVITPVIDATKIDKGIKDINESFNSISGISLDIQSANLSSAFSTLTAKELQMAEIQNRTPEHITNNYDFTQVNNSPKSLSATEIYRQTNNQISRFKRSLQYQGV